ncbi:MAG: hypothetical protein JJT94_11600 [Bernardetiaceae bacterium]|nr:hypothetical protein [Bernardetiaceae bacterium]
MNVKFYISTLLILCFCCHALQAQDDDFDFDSFEAADDSKIKQFCNNKVTNLSPTRLVGLSYDFIGPFNMETDPVTNPDRVLETHPMNFNQGARFDANFPLLSKSSIIINATASYWESRYNGSNEVGEGSFAERLTDNELRTAAAGLLIFKPLNEKHFLVFQAEAALNGNYNFSTINPNFERLKYSATAIFGWKFNDDTNFGVGLTRTYRGGNLLHIPVMLYNKTFNQNWGTELLLPARGDMRYNFSTQSILKFGYELEGQSYLIQTPDAADGSIFMNQDLELRKSEIRFRLNYDKSITDFIWFNVQGGVRIAYRYDLDAGAAPSEPTLLRNDVGLPFYFRFGINLMSP